MKSTYVLSHYDEAILEKSRLRFCDLMIYKLVNDAKVIAFQNVHALLLMPQECDGIFFIERIVVDIHFLNFLLN